MADLDHREVVGHWNVLRCRMEHVMARLATFAVQDPRVRLARTRGSPSYSPQLPVPAQNKACMAHGHAGFATHFPDAFSPHATHFLDTFSPP